MSTGPAYIGAGAFAAALGAKRGEFYRAREAGKIPKPDHETLGGFARWKVETVIAVLRARGVEVPESLRLAAKTRRKG
jgi:hypothetical protein